MSRERSYKSFVCDFETTVFDDQDFTEVWAAACVEIYTEDVFIFHSIGEFFKHIFSIPGNKHLYFHNLKFDGFFILSYLMDVLKWDQAAKIDPETGEPHFIERWQMKNRTFQYLISEMGQFYSITMKFNGQFVEIRDSLKLLPFSVKEIGRSFHTKHQKLEMEYTGFRYAGCEITPEEMHYIKNDVLVVKEALEFLFSEGHNKMTIGSCCLSEYKQIIGGKDRFYSRFPKLDEFLIDKEIYGQPDADAYVRRAYKGGWCYLVPEKANKVYKNGVTADVNSLYPFVMHSDSGSKYPVGKPTFWSGNYIPEEINHGDYYYFVRIKTRFFLKPGYLPTIQIKQNYLYKSTEWLTTSNIFYKGNYYDHYIDLDGKRKPAIVTLTLTQTDFQLLKDHYALTDFEILDGCYFKAVSGLFDEYIDKYKKIKMESTGARRTLAKLFLNNLYGKMASSKNSSFKYCILKEDKSIGFEGVPEFNKPVVYIPVGAAITSYARNYTIRAAQKNFYGANKPGFIYADTDSIHLDIPEEKIKGVKLDSKIFGCWDLESHWQTGLFVRQKTYCEIENGHYNFKCAGLSAKCKALLEISITRDFSKENLNRLEIDLDKLTPEEKDFIDRPRSLRDFKRGLVIPGKLLPKRIQGGIVLQNTTFEMR